ncbi:hypothetical protein AX17_001219 [Amanita inopinata Kibby_2008]|nr:hypothetical protein AX17_001219 [Amanita inopinata Kibby_2008]
MENTLVVIDRANEDLEVRQRFESFKLGKGLPSAIIGHRPVHSRSHSRNMSISSLSVPNPVADDASSESLLGTNVVSTTKRNSHHRRRSSVSTRHESAEMMGVSLPDLPPSLTEDNVNLGEKDSIRRRALWALEGKPDVSYSKVEIPELSTPQMEKLKFEFPSKPSFPPGPGMNNLIGSKRDSFKLLSSSSSAKDQLQTLVEEEEEEEDAANSGLIPVAKPESIVASVRSSRHSVGVKHAAIRPRPASLHLRPLSLTPESLAAASQASSSPSPAVTSGFSGGLKSLSLFSSVSLDESVDLHSKLEYKRRSVIFPSPAHVSCDSTSSFTSSDEAKPLRRSSISYKSSQGVTTNYAGLPTPEMTPKDRRFSLAESIKNVASEDEYFPNLPARARPLSVSEQHFLVKSHNALLARITDLERILSMRLSSRSSYLLTNSRPASLASDFSTSSEQSSSALGEPSDEMLQLIADLKAERDEYKRDVDAWRGRVNELDSKLAMMAKRVEAERREAWIARSRVGLLEVEKASLEKRLESCETSLASLGNEKRFLEVEKRKLQQEVSQINTELTEVRRQLQGTQQDLEEQKRLKATSLPQFDLTRSAPELSDEEDCRLLGYEDEGDSDISFQTSSSDSSDDLCPSGTLPRFDIVNPPFSQSNQDPSMKAHGSRHSLSKTWTFPTGVRAVVDSSHNESDIDRFFGCLGDIEDESSVVSAASEPLEYSYEKSKGLFSEALRAYDGDEETPLMFPGGPGAGTEATEFIQNSRKLESVSEEEGEEEFSEMDEDMFGEAGGICITLTPAQDDDEAVSFHISTSDPPVLPPLNFEPEEDGVSGAISFDFSYSEPSESPTADSRSPTPKAVSPSSIPRLKSSFSSKMSPINISLSEETSQRDCDPYSTPPAKRGGVLPSLIPQAIVSPSPIRAVTVQQRPKLPSTSTFIRPPQRKQPVPTSLAADRKPSSDTNERVSLNSHQLIKPSGFNITSPTASLESSAFKYEDYTYPAIDTCRGSSLSMRTTSSSSTSASTRLSFQNLTNLIPSWTPRIFGADGILVGSGSPFSRTPRHCPRQPSATSSTGVLTTRSYVSKEVQLEKLRLRLEREGLKKRKKSLDLHCRKCDGRPIFL